ncbi:MAG TPA: DUF695 domain-containing protein [Candidatus Limnocylindrales bacterium]|nr:DUF695 domain-containing protein [Candidatus Limnocylindrales bacterium]
MRLFRRNAEPSPDFWTWWDGARDRIAQAIEAGGIDRALVEEISKAVRAIDPRLAWELSKGRSSKHALTVTPEGNPLSRSAAVTWLASAPAPDATWEYFAARQASSSTDGVFVVEGVDIPIAETRAVTSWDPTRRRVSVRLWHPTFERSTEPFRQQVSFLILDNLLGEDDVERWIGRIDPATAPIGGRTPEELRDEVARHAAEPAGETWILGELEDHRGQVQIVMADAAMKRIDLPLSDQHVAVTIGLDGMPDQRVADALNAAEDELVALLGSRATLAGRTTTPFARVIHFVAEEPSEVRAVVGGWRDAHPAWRINLAIEHDPRWEFQRLLGLR